VPDSGLQHRPISAHGGSQSSALDSYSVVNFLGADFHERGPFFYAHSGLWWCGSPTGRFPRSVPPGHFVYNDHAEPGAQSRRLNSLWISLTSHSLKPMQSRTMSRQLP